MHDTLAPGNNHSLDSAASSTPLLQQAGEQASALAQRGLDALHEGTASLRSSARHASDSTAEYIQAEPLKAMLMAAAAGAALMGLVSLLARNSHSR
jgi:ElaB/YqjD/DUF883 family membrane-anchored ribosome-binding protein